MGYAVGTALPVATLAFLAREKVDWIISADNAAIVAATDVTRSHPGLLTALLWWQEALQPRWVYIVGTGVCVWLWRRHRLKSRAIWGFVTMMVAWNLALDIKYIVQRARPIVADPVSTAPGYSFPSGHAANAAAASTVLVIMLWPLLRSRAAAVTACVVAAVVIVLTALDRVFLGVHFPSDVVGGILVGCGLAFASYAGYVGWNPVQPTEPHPTPEGMDVAAGDAPAAATRPRDEP